MSTNSIEEQPFTAILVWKTDDRNKQAELLKAMDSERRLLGGKHSFLRMTIAASIDGKTVFVTAQWRSQEAFDAAVTNDSNTETSRHEFEKWGTLREFAACYTYAVITPETGKDTE